MNENEKLLLKKVMLIIKSFGASYAGVAKYYEFGSLQNWGNDILYAGSHKINFPGIDEWISKKFDEVDQSGILDKHGDHGRVDIDFNVENKQIIIAGYETVFGTDEDFSESDISDSIDAYKEDFKEYIDSGVSEIICTYDGSGDSGQVNSDMAIDGEGGNEVPAFIEDMCYNALETFGGWENNEGSQGNIVFNLEDKTVTINHQWNVERSELFPIEVIDLN